MKKWKIHMDFLVKNYIARTFWTICIVNSLLKFQFLIFHFYLLKIIKNIKTNFFENQVFFY